MSLAACPWQVVLVMTGGGGQDVPGACRNRGELKRHHSRTLQQDTNLCTCLGVQRRAGRPFQSKAVARTAGDGRHLPGTGLCAFAC